MSNSEDVLKKLSETLSRHIPLYTKWFDKLNPQSQYVLYHGQSRFVEEFDLQYLKFAKPTLEEYIFLSSYRGRMAESPLYFLKHYILYILKTPIPKKGLRKGVTNIYNVSDTDDDGDSDYLEIW